MNSGRSGYEYFVNLNSASPIVHHRCQFLKYFGQHNLSRRSVSFPFKVTDIRARLMQISRRMNGDPIRSRQKASAQRLPALLR
jgi:hypothetical protein